MTIEKKDVLKWMDNQIKAYNLASINLGELRNIGLYGHKQIQTTVEGIRELAGACERKYKIEQRDCDEYPFEISISYKKFKFFCIVSQEDLETLQSKT